MLTSQRQDRRMECYQYSSTGKSRKPVISRGMSEQEQLLSIGQPVSPSCCFPKEIDPSSSLKRRELHSDPKGTSARTRGYCYHKGIELWE